MPSVFPVRKGSLWTQTKFYHNFPDILAIRRRVLSPVQSLRSSFKSNLPHSNPVFSTPHFWVMGFSQPLSLSQSRGLVWLFLFLDHRGEGSQEQKKTMHLLARKAASCHQRVHHFLFSAREARGEQNNSDSTRPDST